MRRLALLLALLAPVFSQSRAPKKWTPPRTADGHPDLQGMWTDATVTPFERPPEFAGKAVLTEEEAIAYEKRIADERAHPPKDDISDTYADYGTTLLPGRRTSMVVDPPDGHIPLTPAAEAQRDYYFAHYTDSYQYMSPADRCISRGVPALMFPAPNNSAVSIAQPPGYLVLFTEANHEARIIPLDGRPHLPPSVPQWNGDSRGRWEGDTLVVDTTNFNGKAWINPALAAGPVRGVLESMAAHVVERFTRTGPDILQYEVTMNDPGSFKRPWKVSIPLTRDDEFKMFEFACHEGNRAVELILRGGRAEENGAK